MMRCPEADVMEKTRAEGVTLPKADALAMLLF
jgi:hypothetical protein